MTTRRSQSRKVWGPNGEPRSALYQSWSEVSVQSAYQSKVAVVRRRSDRETRSRTFCRDDGKLLVVPRPPRLMTSRPGTLLLAVNGTYLVPVVSFFGRRRPPMGRLE